MLLFLIFGLVDVGRLMLLNMTLTSAAAEGSRMAARSLGRSIGNITETSKYALASGISPLAYPKCSSLGECLSVTMTNSCQSTGLVTVTTGHTFQFLAPNVVAFAPFVPGINPETGTLDVSASSTALCLD